MEMYNSEKIREIDRDIGRVLNGLILRSAGEHPIIKLAEYRINEFNLTATYASIVDWIGDNVSDYENKVKRYQKELLKWNGEVK